MHMIRVFCKALPFVLRLRFPPRTLVTGKLKRVKGKDGRSEKLTEMMHKEEREKRWKRIMLELCRTKENKEESGKIGEG